MDLQQFDFQGNDVRVTLIDSEPFFVGKDAASAIGYSNTRDAIDRHVKEKYKRVSRFTTPSGTQEMVVISEPGLYQLAGQSKLPSAEPFQDWVYEEVLPSIRKHGAYLTPAKIEEVLSDPDTIINLATQLKSEREGRLIAEQRVNELEPKATYYDLILRNKSLLSITKIAKDYGMSGVALNKKLHELGVQFKQGKTWLLYQKYADKGYTQSQTFVDDTEQSHMRTYWTQAGRLFIYGLLKDNGILPVIERKQSA